MSSCWVFIANSFFLCKTDCWCDEKKELQISLVSQVCLFKVMGNVKSWGMFLRKIGLDDPTV